MKGCTCPCCNQTAKVYKVRLNEEMGRALGELVRFSGRWVHVPSELPHLARSRSYPKLAFWGLIEAQRGHGPDKRCSGYWRVTDLGKRFAFGEITVADAVFLYNGKALGFGRKQINIGDLTGTKFDFREIMEEAR